MSTARLRKSLGNLESLSGHERNNGSANQRLDTVVKTWLDQPTGKIVEMRLLQRGQKHDPAGMRCTVLGKLCEHIRRSKTRTPECQPHDQRASRQNIVPDGGDFGASSRVYACHCSSPSCRVFLSKGPVLCQPGIEVEAWIGLCISWEIEMFPRRILYVR